MRLPFAALVIAALPGLAAAQSLPPLPRAIAPLPSIGLPLPRITPSLPRIGLPPLVEPRSVVTGRPGRDGRRESGRGSRSRGTAILFVPAFAWDDHALASSAPNTPTTPNRSARPGPGERTTGTLRLDVEPHALSASVQVYIDGFFVGTLSDFDDDLELDAGAHRVELRAPGYQTAAFDLRITADRLVTYRHSLEPAAARPSAAALDTPSAGAAPAAPVERTTIYLIPGCYLGNVPPKDAGLPATCDQRRVTTFEP